MNISRRHALMTTLFGAGAVGLRALATGLPVGFFLNPRKALADAPPPGCATKAQFFIMSTSAAGDPINASSPGTYEDTNIAHCKDARLAATKIMMQGKQYTAGKPWSTLPQNVLDRTVFWHIKTDTPVHPKEPDVLRLMGAAKDREMLPSLLAKAVAPCLGTIQAQPISLGATTPAEALAYEGQTMPVIPPVALRDTLANPAGALTTLQATRDQAMRQIYDIYKNAATPPQKAYIDQMVTTQTQVRNIEQSLLDKLSSISDNTIDSQITAAVTLVQMKLAPVITIHIPFGGDNHSDANLAKEADETVTGVQNIASLLSALAAVGLQDAVTFMTLNVFGRTLGPKNVNGRGHNGEHQVSLTIGKPWKGGVIGGVAPVGADYGATAIDSNTGLGSAGGDVSALDSLGAFAKTVLTSVGGDATWVNRGAVITPALA